MLLLMSPDQGYFSLCSILLQTLRRRLLRTFFFIYDLETRPWGVWGLYGFLPCHYFGGKRSAINENEIAALSFNLLKVIDKRQFGE